MKLFISGCVAIWYLFPIILMAYIATIWISLQEPFNIKQGDIVQASYKDGTIDSLVVVTHSYDSYSHSFIGESLFSQWTSGGGGKNVFTLSEIEHDWPESEYDFKVIGHIRLTFPEGKGPKE